MWGKNRSFIKNWIRLYIKNNLIIIKQLHETHMLRPKRSYFNYFKSHIILVIDLYSTSINDLEIIICFSYFSRDIRRTTRKFKHLLSSSLRFPMTMVVTHEKFFRELTFIVIESVTIIIIITIIFIKIFVISDLKVWHIMMGH